MTHRTRLDDHGQPRRPYNRRSNNERDVIEFMGLAKGILSDGTVNQEEVEFVFRWLRGHRASIEDWPLCVLVERITEICADGVVEEAEMRDLADLLQSLVGGKTGMVSTVATATQLPIDRPAPAVEWVDQEFVLTGRFAWGTRDACEAATTCRGGICADNVTQRTRYLVIGTFASRDWISTAHGRKIEAAVDLRDGGEQIAIITEDYWASLLPGVPKLQGTTITKDQLTFNILDLADKPVNITFWRDGKKLIAECSCDEWTDLIYCRHALQMLDGYKRFDPKYESDAVDDLQILARGSNVAAAKRRSMAVWCEW